jgi:glycosyltransferase involved in cell wall biosynthesis
MFEIDAMHILFVHQNFPAQFGHVARTLVQDHGCTCAFVSQHPAGTSDGVRILHYDPLGGATQQTNYLTRSFENAIGHSHGVYETCRKYPEVQPDLIVGHSGFGSTLFLPELYPCPIINYFEYYYHPHGSDLDFRPEYPPEPLDVLRSYCRNATFLLDLQSCRAGYAPTQWQRSLLPEAYRDKVEVIFDGVDTDIWRPLEGVPRQVGPHAIPEGTKIVTYVARGLEMMRGFDIFMKVARRIYRDMADVLFVVVGGDQVVYGGDLKRIPEKSFREHVLKQEEYNLSKFLFTGFLPPGQLTRILALSDVHIYLTVPFVLSWSLFDALACGCAMVASNTPPVRELIAHEETGLLADFYDIDGLAGCALRVLRDPAERRRLGEAGRRLIEEKYALSRTLPQTLAFYQRVAGKAL